MAFARSQLQPADENASHQRELKALGIAKAGPAAGNQRRCEAIPQIDRKPHCNCNSHATTSCAAGVRCCQALSDVYRVLGDVGNLVGSFPTRCNVGKENAAKQAAAAADGKPQVCGAPIVPCIRSTLLKMLSFRTQMTNIDVSHQYSRAWQCLPCQQKNVTVTI